MSWYCTATEHRHAATPSGHPSSLVGYSHWRVSDARTMDVSFELAPASVTVPPGSRKRMEATRSDRGLRVIRRGPSDERKSRNTASKLPLNSVKTITVYPLFLARCRPRRKTPPGGNLGVFAMNMRCMRCTRCGMCVRATYAMRFIFSPFRPSYQAVFQSSYQETGSSFDSSTTGFYEHNPTRYYNAFSLALVRRVRSHLTISSSEHLSF